MLINKYCRNQSKVYTNAIAISPIQIKTELRGNNTQLKHWNTETLDRNSNWNLLTSKKIGQSVIVDRG